MWVAAIWILSRCRSAGGTGTGNGVRTGYMDILSSPDEWVQKLCNWLGKASSFSDPTKRKLIFTTGVIPALSSAVRKLTTPAENVLIQTPVYNNFFNSIRNNGRNVVENELLYDGKEYRVDWEKLEQQLADPQTTLMILCNPQNPAESIWDCETLARSGAFLVSSMDVIVVSG